jgi:uncharacterized repeat protein (TIGR03803 family)
VQSGSESLPTPILRFLLLSLVVMSIHATAPAAAATTATTTTFLIAGQPAAGLLQAGDGNFYATSGASVQTCASDPGEVCAYIFRATPEGVAAIFHAFEPAESEVGTNLDGFKPTSLFVGADGNLYGSCQLGGPGGAGTIFKLLLTGSSAGNVTVLKSFSGTEPGYQPVALIQGADRNFYWTNGIGIYRLTSDGAVSPVYEYPTDPVNGTIPMGTGANSLVQGSDGNLYITESTQPKTNVLDPNIGAVAQLTLSGNLTTLHSFATDGSEGKLPNGPLVQASDGNFYGVTTYSGSNQGPGVAFQVTPGGGFTMLHKFNGTSDGNYTNPLLTLGSDGNLYGTTQLGGDTTSTQCMTVGCGTFYQLTPAGSLTTLHNFEGGAAKTTAVADDPKVDGEIPQASLVQTNGGFFYGTTLGGKIADVTASPTVFKSSLTPAVPAPITVLFNPSQVAPGEAAKLTWTVKNAFSLTAQQCVASVVGGAQGADSQGVWNGKVQAGKLVDGVYTGSTTITPSKAGAYSFALTCGGTESGFGTLKVSGPVLQIRTTALPGGSVGKQYPQFSLDVVGGEEPYHWSLQGALPKGLSFDSSSGSLNGTPLQYGKFPLLFGVVDSETPQQQASTSLILTVQDTLKLSGTYPTAKYQMPYSGGLTVTGGVPPYQWKVVSTGVDSLPDGFTFNTSTGVISGSSKSAYGQFGLTIQVTDSENPKAEVTEHELFTIQPPDLKITSSTFLPSALQGKYYTAALTATGGVPPYSWTTNQPLPPGLTLSSTGVLSGVPTRWSGEGYDHLSISVTDSANPPISVSGYPELHIDTDLKITLESLPTARVGEVYSVALTATGGVSPLTWDLSYSKPFPGSIALVPPTEPDGVWLLQANLTDADNAVVTLTVSDSEKTPASDKVVYAFTVLPTLQPTTTILSSSNRALGTGESVTFTATAASRESGAPSPTGQMIFSSDGATLGTAALDAKGNASFTTSFAHSGVYRVTATYSGSSTYAASTSAAVTETVVTPEVSAAISPNHLHIATGSSGQLQITLTPSADYTGTVHFSCGALPAHVSCTFAPPTLTIAAGSGPVVDILTVSTDSTQTAMNLQQGREGPRDILAVMTAFCFPGSLAALLGLSGRKRTPKRLRKGGLITIFLLLCAGTLSGCHSGVQNITPTGTYTIPVTFSVTGGTPHTINATVIIV